MDPFNAVGNWWLPEREDKKIGGTLTFEHGRAGLRLRLIGSFGTAAIEKNGLIQKYPIVFGETTDGEKITLRDTRVVDSHSVLTDFTPEGPKQFESHELDAVEVFCGAHLPLGAETPVKGVAVELHLLDDWAWATQPLVRHVPADDLAQQRVEYRVPTPVEFHAFGGSARLVAGFSTKSTGWHDQTVTRPAALVVEFDVPPPYSSIFDVVVKPFQYFLTFACSASTQLTDLSFWTEAHGYQAGETWVPKTIKTARLDLSGPPEWRTYWCDLMLPLWSIEGRIGDVIAKWSWLIEHAESALDLFCGLSLGPPQYLETRFLFAVQALEVYHRRCPWFTQRLMPRDEWRKKRDALLAAVKNDNELEQWVEERLPEFANEPRLRDRLTELVAHGGDHAIRVLRDDFINVATQTRHGLTHYDPARKGAKGADLYWLAEEAMALMEACLLLDLGLAQEEILEATGRTQRTRDLLNQNHKR
jgi:hypothetical protein